jgi:hypothetical protein
MAPKLRKAIARAVNDALLQRDRAEMRAVDALLSVIEPPPRRRTKTRRRIVTKRLRR